MKKRQTLRHGRPVGVPTPAARHSGYTISKDSLFMNTWKISHRLMAGFGLVIAILLGMSIFSVYIAQGIDAALSANSTQNAVIQRAARFCISTRLARASLGLSCMRWVRARQSMPWA